MSDKIRISGSVYIEKKLFAQDRGILAYLSDEGHIRIIRFCMGESKISEQRNLLLSYFRYLTTELGLQQAYKLFERLQPVLQKEMKGADPSVRKLVLLSDECGEPSLEQLEDDIPSSKDVGSEESDSPLRVLNALEKSDSPICSSESESEPDCKKVPVRVRKVKRSVEFLVRTAPGCKREENVKIPSDRKTFDKIQLEWFNDEAKKCKFCGRNGMKTTIGILEGFGVYIECCGDCAQGQQLQNIVDTLLLKEKSQCCDDL